METVITVWLVTVLSGSYSAPITRQVGSEFECRGATALFNANRDPKLSSERTGYAVCSRADVSTK